MTRRLSTTPHRLLRSRPQTRRAEHAVGVALPMSCDARRRIDVDPEPAPQRDTDCALQSLVHENALLTRELGRVQQRCSQWRDDCIAQTDRLESTLMRARADAIVKETQLALLRDALDALQKSAAAWLANEAPARRLSVLCVGGRARQVPVYRELVERRGGRFAHVDGSGADCLADLACALPQADVVILQAGYACHGACSAVEAHCARTGTRYIRLDKACALGFEQSLERALAPRSSAAGQAHERRVPNNES